MINSLLLVAFSAANAQESDQENIKLQLKRYVEGWRAGDMEMLSTVLDPGGSVMWISEGDDGNEVLRSMSFEAILKREKSSPHYGLEWEVLSLDILDERLAMAKVKISRKNGHFIDYLAFHKINSQWRLVNKTFVTR